MKTTGYEPHNGETLVTPLIAAKWLERRGPYQRSISAQHVARIVADIKAGRYKNTGDPIKFDRHRCLMDGQHRLQAVIDSGTAILCDVKTGMDPETWRYIDSHKPRTGIDLNVSRGKKNAPTRAAAQAWLYRYHNTAMRSISAGGTHGLVTKVGLDDWCLKNLDDQLLDDAAAKGAATSHVSPGGPLAACYYVFASIDRDQADVFFDALKVGDHLKKGEPVHVLRERLLRDNSGKEKKTKGADLVELVICAWNSDRSSGPSGTDVKLGADRTSEKFPKAR